VAGLAGPGAHAVDWAGAAELVAAAVGLSWPAPA